jgi:hypothetical protein
LKEYAHRLAHMNSDVVAVTDEDNQFVNPMIDKNKMFMCMPPRIYTQKYYDSIEVITGTTRDMASSSEEMRQLVNYYLYPVEKKLEKVFLAGKHALVQGMEEKPVLPNTTHEDIFYDCGCRAWPKEMLDMRSRNTVMQETMGVYDREGFSRSEEDSALVKWTGSPAGETFYGAQHHFGHAHTRFELLNGMSVRAVNLVECKEVLDQCLDGFGSTLTADTGTADEISAAIDDGFDRESFTQSYLVWLCVSVTLVFSFSLGITLGGIFVLTYGLM